MGQVVSDKNLKIIIKYGISCRWYKF
jgi:hypothetical protein